MIEDPVEAWLAGQLALSLLAIDPDRLRGVHIRARSGPARDMCLAAIPKTLQPLRRITPAISDTQLFGGVDLAATLSSGRIVQTQGLLKRPEPILLTMAERCHSELAARLAQALDASGPALLLLDEGADADERAPDVLTERVAFSLSLEGLRAADLAEIVLDPADIARARTLLPRVTCAPEVIAALTVTALRFGIWSLRAPTLALATARANAALNNRETVTFDDVALAAQLVFSHRATQVPETPDASKDDMFEDEPPPDTDTAPPADQSQTLPEDMLIDAVRALLPPDLLAALSRSGGTQRSSGTGGAGSKRKSNRRGRPLPPRQRMPRDGDRIDIVASLRAAAPWQAIRRRNRPDAPGLLLRTSDIHVRRFEDLSDRLVIFAVDASGSAAVARLAEAKGAVEMMLADAYARRDHVALIGFRGEDAQVILPPTRSLVQTKRRLACMPGGGGTPLAAGLKAAATLARSAQGQGLSPCVAILTDGRANVPLPGRKGRVAAREDAHRMAGLFVGTGWPVAVVDTGMRPQEDLAKLAQALSAHYLPLPRADAKALNRAIGSAFES